MPKLWLTYAWKDNEDADIDHVVAMLEREGLEVHFDRKHLVAGQRLWPSLDKAITDPSSADAWAIFATENSLASEPCREEIVYALDRALTARSAGFPLIGIFPRPLDRALIPSAIATRLYVFLQDPAWARAVAAGVERKNAFQAPQVEPFRLKVHPADASGVVVEVRPRSGRWYPVAAMVPVVERGLLLEVIRGPSGTPPLGGMVHVREAHSNDGLMSGFAVLEAIDNLNSLYVKFSRLPSQLVFGSQEENYIARLASS